MPGIAAGRDIRATDFTFDPDWIEDFWEKGTVDRNGCLIWTHANTDGYGVTSHSGVSYMVRRVAVALDQGECPAGKPVGATCFNRACYNPSHLYVGSVASVLGNAATANPVWRGSLTPQEVKRIRQMWGKKKVTEVASLFPHVSKVVVSHVGNNITHFDPDYTPVSHASCDLAWGSKLSSKRVARARRRREAGWSLQRLADSEGVAFSTMYEALHGMTWKCVHDVEPVTPKHLLADA